MTPKETQDIVEQKIIQLGYKEDNYTTMEDLPNDKWYFDHKDKCHLIPSKSKCFFHIEKPIGIEIFSLSFDFILSDIFFEYYAQVTYSIKNRQEQKG